MFPATRQRSPAACFGDANGGAVQFFDAIAHADGGEFIAAGVEGEGLENFGAGFAKFAVQFEERFGIVERDFRRKRACANAAALFEFEEVAAVAENEPSASLSRIPFFFSLVTTAPLVPWNSLPIDNHATAFFTRPRFKSRRA